MYDYERAAGMQRNRQQRQAPCSLALSLLLGHPSISSEARTICTMACVCQAWQQAVQQTCTCNTSISIGGSATLSDLTSFAVWLPKHAQVVKTLSLNISSTSLLNIAGVTRGIPAPTYRAIAQVLLQQSLMLASSRKGAAAAASTGAASRQQLLQLQCFGSNYLATPAALAALPASSLTELSLDFEHTRPLDGKAVAAELVKLSNLRRLSLPHTIAPEQTQIPGDVVTAVSALKRLTCLKLSAYKLGKELQELLQQPLPLRQLEVVCKGADPFPQLDMASLTALRCMSFRAAKISEGTVFPQQLMRLSLRAKFKEALVLAVAALPSLQQLTLHVKNSTAGTLLPLASMSQLKRLELKYPNFSIAAYSAPTWLQLRRLRALHIGRESARLNRTNLNAVLNVLDAAGSAARLTSLQLELGLHDTRKEDDPEFGVVQVCERLGKLTKLQRLSITDLAGVSPARDCLHLTTLTRLTSLSLSSAIAAAGDMAASALACNLTQLRNLDLAFCDLCNMACLAPIGKLTKLTRLCLMGNGNMTSGGLMLLTRLTGLLLHNGLELDVFSDDDEEAVDGSLATAETMRQFWSAVQQQLQ